MDPFNSPPRSRASGRSGPRTKLGCLTCRRRKVRCDQPNGASHAQTRCGNCSRLNLDCYYPPPGAPSRRSRKSADGVGRNSPRTTSVIRQAAGYDTGQLGGRDAGNNEGTDRGETASSNESSSQYNSYQQAMFMAPTWLPQSDINPLPQLDPPPTQDYLPQQESPGQQIQLDRVFGEMSGLSGFPDADVAQWQTTFPSGILSPLQDLFVSPLLPWKGPPTRFNSPTGNNVTGPPGQVQQSRFRSSIANLSRRQSAPASSSTSTPMPMPTLRESGIGDTPRKRPSTSVDLAMFDVTEHQRSLLGQFNATSNPIPLVAPIDSQWKSAYLSLMSMAHDCSYLINAICAVSELHLASSRRGSVEQAFVYYQSATTKAEAILEMASIRVEDWTLKQAFATLFLLMHAEIMAQPLAGPRRWPTTHLRTAYRRLRQHNEKLRSWTGIGSHILSWIQIIDSKAVYAAGMENETDRPSPDTDLPANQPSPNGTVADTTSAQCPSPGPSRSVHLSSDTPQDQPIPPARVLDTRPPADEPPSAAEIAYDALNRPAYRFFLRCQAFIPRIISLDRHHRPRGTLDAEFDVLRAGQRLRAELRDLWVRRPAGLDVLADGAGLLEVLHPQVAGRIMRGFAVYVAHFHAIGILLHRVAFIHYPATEEVRRAIKEILRLARDQIVGGSGDVDQNGGCASGVQGPSQDGWEPGDGSLGPTAPPHVGLSSGIPWLWPLFMCGLECSLEEREWVLDRMHGMKGSVNAERTAILLSEVTKRQDERDERVDQRSVRQDIFDDDFSVVY